MSIVTARLELRPAEEGDRGRFVELFSDEDFWVFHDSGPLDPVAANQRFDQMLQLCGEIPWARQPVIERATGAIVGYLGLAPFDLDGTTWLELGYRLSADARGKGYATEAGRALLERATQHHPDPILAIIDPDNEASLAVARKLGFSFWKSAPVAGKVRTLLLTG